MSGEDCWILGVTKEQWKKTPPGTVSTGWPLMGDLSRFRGDPEAEAHNRRALVQQFGLVYPEELKAMEHPSLVVIDPHGLWSFSCKAKPGDLMLVHVQKGEAREAVAIVRITGPYRFISASPWPHVLPVICLSRDSWEIPPRYWGRGDYLCTGQGAQDLVAMIRERIRLRLAGTGEPC